MLLLLNNPRAIRLETSLSSLIEDDRPLRTMIIRLIIFIVRANYPGTPRLPIATLISDHRWH